MRNLSDGTVVDADICIVGAGAAGITLAMELLGHNLKIALLESGGLDFEDDIQALNEGDCVSEHKVDLTWTRLRYFGGTTGHWGGNCAQLDEHDFQERSWVPDSGWPIEKRDLERFYPRAGQYCELPSDNYSTDHWAEVSAEFRASRIPVTGESIGEKLFLKSPPTRFGDVYRAQLTRPGNQCTVYLHANVTEIETGEDVSQVLGLRTRDLDGRSRRFTARIYILASGIENARLLLLSNKVRPNGLGNDHDVVGRYFMAHSTIRTGRALLTVPRSTARFYGLDSWASRFESGGAPFVNALQPPYAVQEREEMLNSVVFFDESYEGERAPGFVALRHIMKQIIQGRVPDNLGTDLGKVLADLDSVAKALYARVSGDSQYRALELRYFAEQAPNRDSRVMLGADRDRLGQNKLVLDWRLQQLDKHTILRTQQLIAQEFGKLGVGRLKVDFDNESDPWPKAVDSSAHFMGTTRMHRDPRHGVVDEHCRVHGIGNLYVAGGSVFPTAGATMVTMNIVALAVRLADHLIGKFA
ncbi:GMC oxidoreductase [Skermanella stibiiresistens]|uniref:GMC oxidoreductase n=1 Tax=Skermanella stibiiresistens TaxID=913326 RepID=UPI0004B22EA9|nr:GMC family oxidoreductase [Skermanella stibiiresistens]